MRKLLITAALLSTTALPSMAADMPLKAQPAAVPYTDWSSIYIGGAAGYAWGKEKLDHVPTTLGTLFGTSVASVFDGTPSIVQPNFDLRGFSSNRSLNGFIGGGFVGAQKQWGNIVFGLEASFDATGMKKSLNETTSVVDTGVIRFLPTTTFTVGPLSVTAGGSVTIPGQSIQSTGTITIPGQTITSTGTLQIDGQKIQSTGTITVPGQEIKSTGTVDIPGQLVSLCLDSKCANALKLPFGIGTVTAQVPPQTVNVTVTGNTAEATINVVVNGETQTVKVPVSVTGQTLEAKVPVTVNGATVDKTVQVTVTGQTGTQNITLTLPQEERRTATVTRNL